MEGLGSHVEECGHAVKQREATEGVSRGSCVQIRDFRNVAGGLEGSLVRGREAGIPLGCHQPEPCLNRPRQGRHFPAHRTRHPDMNGLRVGGEHSRRGIQVMCKFRRKRRGVRVRPPGGQQGWLCHLWASCQCARQQIQG